MCQTKQKVRNTIIAGNEEVVAGRVTHSVLFGQQNVADGTQKCCLSGSVLGGEKNTVRGMGAVVVGGARNAATGKGASVSGGQNNTSSGICAAVSGGGSNCAVGYCSLVSGGQGNTANAKHSSSSGGRLASLPVI